MIPEILRTLGFNPMYNFIRCFLDTMQTSKIKKLVHFAEIEISGLRGYQMGGDHP